MSFDKNTILLLSGLIWGIAGFAVEIVPSQSAQSAVRMVFITMSTILILSAVPIRMGKIYYLGAILLTLYLVTYIISNIIHVASSSFIFREIMFFYVLMVLYILISDEKQLESFTKGIFFSLCMLVIYYFINTDLTAIFNSNYRLFTKLGPNGIGSIAIMLFILLYFYLISSINNIQKIPLIIMMIACITVIIATRSRTALIMLVFSTFFINTQHRKWYALITLIVISILLYVVFTDEISTVLRLESHGIDSRGKSLTNLTGRVDLWGSAIDVIQKNFFFGVGPEDAYVMVDGNKASYHNAYIQIFVSIGFIGLFPILILLFISLINLLSFKYNNVYKIIFLTGLIGSISEAHLLNYGSPGNLLFLISFIYLGTVYKNESSTITPPSSVEKPI